MDYVPILFISAKTGQRVDQVLPLALKVQEERLAHVTTGALNRILQNAQELHSPTSRTRVLQSNCIMAPRCALIRRLS